MKIKTVVFDLGGVLIDWNPSYLYKDYFSDDEEMKFFLQNVCHSDWNFELDRGKPFAEAVEEKILEFPKYKDAIALYQTNWHDMLGGSIGKNVEILEKLKEQGLYKLLALTNWSAETFPIAKKKFPFLSYFEDVLVSGEVNMAKPDECIFIYLLERHDIRPEECVFIDDNLENIATARRLGFVTVHYDPFVDLKRALGKLLVL